MSGVFPADFLVTLRGLVGVHQSIYPDVPPQGIYFESLVEDAFKRIKKPFTIIEATSRNQPRHDLLVENTRISLNKLLKNPVLLVACRTGIPACLLFAATCRRATGKNACPTGFFNNLLKQKRERGQTCGKSQLQSCAQRNVIRGPQSL